MTDPDSGLFVKGNYKRPFAYEAPQSVETTALGVALTAENGHDSVVFDEMYDKVTGRFPVVKTVTADSACKTLHICKDGTEAYLKGL